MIGVELPEGVTQDRRRPEGVLLAVMKHVSERIEEVEKRNEHRFSTTDNRIRELQDSIISFIEKTPDALMDRVEIIIDEAIPTSPDNPDATPREKRKEHRKAHAKWIDEVNEEMKSHKRLLEEVKKWALIAVLGFVFAATWAAFLRGPSGSSPVAAERVK